MEDHCLFCHVVIPEGRQICPLCEMSVIENRQTEPAKQRDVKALEELIRKIELILIEEGQHDKRFKWGDFIKYAPYEVAEILRKHSDELHI